MPASTINLNRSRSRVDTKHFQMVCRPLSGRERTSERRERGCGGGMALSGRGGVTRSRFRANTFWPHRETGRDLPSLRRQKLHYFGGFTTTWKLVSASQNVTSLPPKKIGQSDAAARQQPLWCSCFEEALVTQALLHGPRIQDRRFLCITQVLVFITTVADAAAEAPGNPTHLRRWNSYGVRRKNREQRNNASGVGSGT